MTRLELQRFCAQRSLAVVGSISPEGAPQSALVGIAVTEELEIVFDTLKTTRKYRNLVLHPKASVLIGWDGEKTVQYEGEAFLPEGEALSRYKSVYFAKWPDGRDRESWPGMVYFVIRPLWIRYSSYDERPPLIEEFPFEG